jgi:hypothetical protein
MIAHRLMKGVKGVGAACEHEAVVGNAAQAVPPRSFAGGLCDATREAVDALRGAIRSCEGRAVNSVLGTFKLPL